MGSQTPRVEASRPHDWQSRAPADRPLESAHLPSLQPTPLRAGVWEPRVEGRGKQGGACEMRPERHSSQCRAQHRKEDAPVPLQTQKQACFQQHTSAGLSEFHSHKAGSSVGLCLLVPLSGRAPGRQQGKGWRPLFFGCMTC